MQAYESIRLQLNYDIMHSLYEIMRQFLNFKCLLLLKAVGIATAYGLDDRGVGVRVQVELRNLISPSRSDRLWGLLNLLSKGYRGSSPRG
jgi:hypothetical protein